MKKSLRKIMKAAFTMFFNNIVSAMIRLKIMTTEQSVEHGFTMAVKNFILIALHLCYIRQMLEIYVGSRKQIDHDTCSQILPKNKLKKVKEKLIK